MMRLPWFRWHAPKSVAEITEPERTATDSKSAEIRRLAI